MSSSAARNLPGGFGKRISARTAGLEDPEVALTKAERSQPSEAPDPGPGRANPSVDGLEFPPAFPDEVLMERVSDGDREALACLFRRYARVVHAISYRILRDSAEADDLLQEIFLFVYRKSDIFDSAKSTARSWIVQMTYHRAIDRRRYLHSRHFYTRVDLNGATEVPDPRSNGVPHNGSVGGLVGEMTVQGLLSTLTEDQRNTLSLYFFDGYTFDEIAAKLGQSWGNVRNHYYRGLDKLRRQMSPDKLPGHQRCDKK